MMEMLRRTAGRSLAAVLCVAALAGCTQGPEKTPLEVELIQLVGQQVKQRLADAPQRPPLTRALLDTIDSPYIEVTLEANGIFAYLTPQLVRRDDGSGEVEVWVTEDAVSVTLRDGVLIATRGLRGDMLSASTLVRPGGPQGPEGQGARAYAFRTGDNEARRVEMACVVTDLGLEALEVVEITYKTRHLQERCENDAGVVVNDYWIDSRTGRFWQSRQWAGPLNGYIRIRQLTL